MRIFGLIGYPLSHSFSRKYFLEKIKKNNITDAGYYNFSLSDINEFKTLLKSDKNLAGFNVTSPYKEKIIPFLDELDKSASKINAVNVIKIINKNNKKYLIGYNTDIYGFKISLLKKLDKNTKNALILGTGGAAKATAYALEELNIKYKFVSRKKTNKNTLTYNNLNNKTISNNKLIINATPVGIFPDTNAKPDIPYNALTGKHHLFDLIYNPEKTLFLKEGEKKGATIQNGLEMLYLQAEKAAEIFEL